MGKKLKENDIVLFGLVNRLNKTLQKKATEAGFDLVFPKSLFCKNLSVIANQVKIFVYHEFSQNQHRRYQKNLRKYYFCLNFKRRDTL